MKEEHKICNFCGESKSLSEYYFQKKINKDGEESIYYQPTCKVCVKKKSAKWQSEHKERHNACCRKQYAENRHDRRNRDKANTVKSRERGVFLEWQRNNKDKIKQYAENRKSKQHSISTKEWKRCLEFFDDSCAYCGLSNKEHKEKYKKSLHKEHVDPNGSNGISNCVPACIRCNSSKGVLDMKDWYSKTEYFEDAKLVKIYEWLSIIMKENLQ